MVGSVSSTVYKDRKMEALGYIYIIHPHWGGSGTRSPLIFWDTFPRYLRILFHPKK